MLMGLQFLQMANQHGRHGDAPTSVSIAGIFFLVGFADLVCFLGIGLVYAYLPQLKLRHGYQESLVLRRYALDDKLNEIDDHPSPFADCCTAVVEVRLPNGKRQRLHPSESAYEFCKPGCKGLAVIRGQRLERFVIGQR